MYHVSINNKPITQRYNECLQQSDRKECEQLSNVTLPAGQFFPAMNVCGQEGNQQQTANPYSQDSVEWGHPGTIIRNWKKLILAQLDRFLKKASFCFRIIP